MSRARAWVGALAAVLVAAPLALTTVTPALAADSATVSVAPLPYTPAIRGAGGQSSVIVTLPTGGVPSRLTGTIRSTYDHDGDIVVTVNGRRAAQVPAREGGDVDAALTDDDISNGQIVIGMYADLVPTEDCFVDQNSTASLVGGSIGYSHPVEAPTTIGGFLSNGLSSVTVQVGANASPQEQAAALDAVAALVHRFRPPTVVRLVASDAQPTGDFLRRTVLVQAAMDTATDTSSDAPKGGRLEVVGGEFLRVTAPPDELASTTVALADPALALAQVPSLDHVTGTADWAPVTGPSTLAALGVAPVSLSGVGKVTAVVGVGQPAFGGSLSGLTMTLNGVITPLPPGATGRVDFLWNGVLTASRDMTDDTALSQTLDIPAEQLQRDNTLSIELSYVPATGKCTPPPLPARLDIDPRLSTVKPTFGTSVGPGFQRFPQVLGAVVPVAFGPAGTTPQLVQQAGDLVSGLAAATPEQLVTSIVSVDTIANGDGPGLVLGADGALTQRLEAPYSVGGVVEVRDTTSSFTAELTGPLALGQAFAQGNRDLVLLGPIPDSAGSPALALTDDFGRRVATDPARWSALTGRIMALGATGQLEEIPLPPPPTAGINTASLLTIALIATGLLIACVIVWSWLRPKDPPPPMPGAPASS